MGQFRKDQAKIVSIITNQLISPIFLCTKKEDKKQKIFFLSLFTGAAACTAQDRPACVQQGKKDRNNCAKHQ